MEQMFRNIYLKRVNLIWVISIFLKVVDLYLTSSKCYTAEKKGHHR